MRGVSRSLWVIFGVALIVAAGGFVSTIDVRLWGHPWAEKAQDAAMFGGLGVMIVTGILLILSRIWFDHTRA